MGMGRSEVARLIHSEQVYKERIRQLENAVSELRAKVQYYESIVRDYESHEYPEPVILEAEIVEPWTMFHDPDGNEYGK